MFPRAQRRQALRSSWLSWSVWLKATVLKKAVQRFLLICLFWFVLDIDLEKWGGQGANATVLRPPLYVPSANI
ncbi:hypothetical protein DWT96_13140 [Enterococcus faecium]|nr:hypothetical protein [Enterococcus faecium]PQC27871.1 hypothetical protein CUM93_13280 [Enterococcus faecium]PQC99721.1 hypothetical protein CUM76_10810 [Enterococcus faecium]PQD88629.1 hypothetical protein CUM70_11715 [Enterococcus faecium]